MPQLRHVLWIGGPPGCGKTSVARWLATRHDLRVYNADAHTWEHHDRSLELALPTTERWQAMTPDERWLATPPGEMAEHSLEMNADRFRLIAQDLGRLPDSPLVVVEGTPLLPLLVADLLASRAHAVWLLPTTELQRALLEERTTTTWDQTSDPHRAVENRIERERLVGEAIEADAAALGFATLRVDESLDLAAAQSAVELHFRPLLDAGTRAASGLRRAENATILNQLRTYLERIPAASEPGT